MKPEKFKFGVLTEKGNAEIHEKELPEVGPSEVLLKQNACNICTTDYQQWMGLREHQGYPMAGGHECSAEIIETGEDVTGSIAIGDQVAIIYDYCGYCEACKVGEVTGCLNKEQFGKNYSDEYYGIFGFANYFVREAKSLVKIETPLGDSKAGFVEPLSTVVRSMKKLRVNSGYDTMVIVGAGTMGLLNAQLGRAMGARVIVSAKREKQINIAEKMGFEVIDTSENDPVEKVKELTNGRGADIVVVAVGATSANNQALEMVKEKDGKISLFSAGYPAPEMDIDSNKIHYMRLELIGTYGSTLQDFNDAAKLLSERRVEVSDLIEEVYPLSDIQNAFEKASSSGTYRVSLKLN